MRTLTSYMLLSLLIGCGTSEPISQNAPEPKVAATSKSVKPPADTSSATKPAPTAKPAAPATPKTPPPSDLPAPDPAPKTDEDSGAVDLAEYGHFFTIDLPPHARIQLDLPLLEIDFGDDNTLTAHPVSNSQREGLLKSFDESMDRSRKVSAPEVLLIDKPNIVVSGDPETDQFSVLAKHASGRFIFTISGCPKETALQAASSCESFRQTDANKAARGRYLKAQAKLKQLGCAYREDLGRALSLQGRMLTDGSLGFLADMPPIMGVVIAAPKLTPACLAHLRQLRQLKYVILAAKHIDGSWLPAMRDLNQIQLIRITEGSIAPDAWAPLGELRHLSELKITIPVSTQCLQAISKLPKLTWVELEYCDIDDAMLAHLKLQAHEGLRLLLVDNPITDAGLAHLEGFKQLESLDLQGTDVTAAGVQKLKAALPKCTIFFEE